MDTLSDTVGCRNKDLYGIQKQIKYIVKKIQMMNFHFKAIGKVIPPQMLRKPTHYTHERFCEYINYPTKKRRSNI